MGWKKVVRLKMTCEGRVCFGTGRREAVEFHILGASESAKIKVVSRNRK